MSHSYREYASDLSDAQWATLQGILPERRGQVGRPMQLDLRAAVNAIFYVVRTGCQWSNLPKSYPHAKSVYYHFRKWCLDGTWARLNCALVYLERQRSGRFAHPSAGVIDSQSAKTTECAGMRSYDGGKKVNGRKRHILTDSAGNLLLVVAHPAGLADSLGATQVFAALPAYWRRTLQLIWADGGYSDKLSLWLEPTYHIRMVVVKRSQTGFQLLPRRWVVERTFAWLGRYRRLSKDYERCPKSSETIEQTANRSQVNHRLAA